MSVKADGTLHVSYRQAKHKSVIIKLPEVPIQGALLWRG
jgi:hypothetical protein